MQRIKLYCCVILLALLAGCTSVATKIEKSNDRREAIVVKEARAYFEKVGGSINDFPGLFDKSANREIRWNQYLKAVKKAYAQTYEDHPWFSIALAARLAAMLTLAD